MKTAVILFNIPERQIYNSPEAYLTLCSDMVFRAGYTPIHSNSWREYDRIDKEAFIAKTNMVIDAFFLFVDYGISPLMLNIVKEHYTREESEKNLRKDLIINIALTGTGAGLASILLEVSEIMNIPVEVLKTRTKTREVALARQFYFKRARLFTNDSLIKIGALVNRDHATVLHGVRLVNECPSVRKVYEKIFEGNKRERKLKNGVPEELSNEDKDVLIGRSPVNASIINMRSPYSDFEKANDRPYSGYRVHSL